MAEYIWPRSSWSHSASRSRTNMCRSIHSPCRLGDGCQLFTMAAICWIRSGDGSPLALRPARPIFSSSVSSCRLSVASTLFLFFRFLPRLLALLAFRFRHLDAEMLLDVGSEFVPLIRAEAILLLFPHIFAHSVPADHSTVFR